MSESLGSFCAKHNEYSQIGVCRWCEPPRKAVAQRSPDVLPPGPPLEWVIGYLASHPAGHWQNTACSCGQFAASNVRDYSFEDGGYRHTASECRRIAMELAVPLATVAAPAQALRKHYVIAVGSNADFTNHYLCQCGYSGEFQRMAVHLRAWNASAASAAPTSLP